MHNPLITASGQLITSSPKHKTCGRTKHFTELLICCIIVQIFNSTAFLDYKLLNPLDRFLLDKKTVPQVIMKRLQFYVNRRFSIVFTEVSICPVSNASQMNPFQTYTSSLKSHFNKLLPSTPRSSEPSLSFKFRYENHEFSLPNPMHATSAVHLALLYFISRTIFGEEYHPWGANFVTTIYSES